jgi:myosin-crossreactive antigen
MGDNGPDVIVLSQKIRRELKSVESKVEKLDEDLNKKEVKIKEKVFKINFFIYFHCCFTFYLRFSLPNLLF